MFLLNREELAWAAGFFDGEGCTTNHQDTRGKSNFYNQPHMSINQAEPFGREILERFRAAVGGLGRVNGPYWHVKRPHRKSYYTYSLEGRRQVQAVVAMLWQFLGRVKKDQILRVFHTPSIVRKEPHTMGEGKSMRDDPQS